MASDEERARELVAALAVPQTRDQRVGKVAAALTTARREERARLWEMLQERAHELEGAALRNDSTPHEHGGPIYGVSEVSRLAASKLRAIMDELETEATDGDSEHVPVQLTARRGCTACHGTGVYLEPLYSSGPELIGPGGGPIAYRDALCGCVMPRGGSND